MFGVCGNSQGNFHCSKMCGVTKIASCNSISCQDDGSFRCVSENVTFSSCLNSAKGFVVTSPGSCANNVCTPTVQGSPGCNEESIILSQSLPIFLQSYSGLNTIVIGSTSPSCSFSNAASLQVDCRITDYNQINSALRSSYSYLPTTTSISGN